MPMPDTADQTAIALGRSSSGNTLAMIDRVAGIVRAAPMPMNARPDQLVGGRDERRQDAADAEDREAGEERQAPPVAVGQGAGDEQQSGEHEDVGVDHPLELAGRGGSSWASVGRATFRIVLSSVAAKRLRMSTPRIHQRRAWIWAWDIGTVLLGNGLWYVDRVLAHCSSRCSRLPAQCSRVKYTVRDKRLESGHGQTTRTP